MMKTAPSSKNFHIKMEDSWSRWIALSKKGGQPPIIFAGYEVERNVQLEKHYSQGEPGFFQARAQRESSVKNLCGQIGVCYPWNKSSTRQDGRSGQRRMEKEAGERKGIYIYIHEGFGLRRV